MNTRIRLATLVCLLLVFSSGVLAAETLESVEKQIIARWSKLTSLTAKTTMVMNMQGMSMTSEGTIECMKRGDKELLRMEMTMKQSMGGQSKDTAMSVIMDGEYVYNMTEMMGHKRAMKQKPDSFRGAVGGKRVFEDLKREHELKLLPDEKVDGQAVFVIKATPKGAKPKPYTNSKNFFAKDTGIMVKMIGVDAGGNEVMTMTVSDVKRNPEIDPDRFVFKAPEGVQVMDVTGQ